MYMNDFLLCICIYFFVIYLINEIIKFYIFVMFNDCLSKKKKSLFILVSFLKSRGI